MCFIHIDIFTQSLWLMNKHQLQNNNKKTKKKKKGEKVLATSARKTNEARGQFTSNSVIHPIVKSYSFSVFNNKFVCCFEIKRSHL